MAETVLGGVITFFQKIGIYDVVLPFLLTFTIVFAILEKTKILGTEKIKTEKGGEVEYTRKTLNSLTAFVVSFLVIASSKLVEAITAISSQMIIVIMLVLFFLLAVGIFFGSEEDVSLEKKSGWRTFFMFVVFIAILAIFLNAMKTSDGNTWLEVFVGILAQFTTNTVVAAVVLLIGIILFMYFIIKPKKESEEKKK